VLNVSDKTQLASRRGFLTGMATAAGASLAAPGALAATTPMAAPTELFHGTHQGGIVTPQQGHSYFAAFDLVTDDRDDVVALLKAWTAAAERLTQGKTAQALADPLRPVGAVEKVAAKGDAAYDTPGPTPMVADTGEALGLPPARLTVTFGFGPGLFIKHGTNRYGLAARRPAALVDLPKFSGDQLVVAQTGGDLSVQACAEDQQVAFHAVRQLARIADKVARIRWVQAGFLSQRAPETPRNLMGFKDGTINPSPADPHVMNKFVWVGDAGPDWMQGGAYLVTRRIRIALEHWDRMQLVFQEQTIGRHKYSGAPLGKAHEADALDLAATDNDGNPIIPQNAHVRLAAAETNGGAQILRRGYSYNDGVNFTAERWPTWRQGLEYDAGLFFVCYQSDPGTGFIKIFERVSKFDMMNQFATHVGSGMFACPGGIRRGEFVGQRLFRSV
jgi:deferrochelatase/peroxidase EfeB